jgi:CubicO group peptidase (beta-lactamase class C family)
MYIRGLMQRVLSLVVLVCLAGCSAATPLPEDATVPPRTSAVALTPTAAHTRTSAAKTIAAPGVATDRPSSEGGDATATHAATVAAAAPTVVETAPVAVAVPPATRSDYWPTDGWRTSTPEQHGADAEQLERMFSVIDERQLNVHSVLVIRDGYIIAERYYAPFDQDTRHQLFSVTKSFISALIGIAIADGFIDGLDSQVVGFFPGREFANLDDRKAAMTLEHLLTMTSGLDWAEGVPTYQEMARTRDWVHYVLDKPMVAEPGTQFNYCSGCSHIMSAIIQETTGIGTQAFAESLLFGPLGIWDVDWETDGSGIPNGGWGLNLTPRDMAKLGLLYLNDGFWDGQQVVPPAWVQASVSDGVDTGDGWRYGYQWWLDPSNGRFAAIGLASQLIYVIPELNMVVVFTAALGDNSVLFDLVDDYLVSGTEK